MGGVLTWANGRMVISSNGVSFRGIWHEDRLNGKSIDDLDNEAVANVRQREQHRQREQEKREQQERSQRKRQQETSHLANSKWKKGLRNAVYYGLGEKLGLNTQIVPNKVSQGEEQKRVEEEKKKKRDDR